MSTLRRGMPALVIRSPGRSNVGLPVLLEADLGREPIATYRGIQWMNGTGHRVWGVRALGSRMLIETVNGMVLADFAVMKGDNLMPLLPADESVFLEEMERHFEEVDGARRYRFLPRPPGPRA